MGLQAQEPQAPFIGLWSRLTNFSPHELSELIAQRSAVRGTLMRATIHLVTRADWARLRPLIDPVIARQFKGSPFSKALQAVQLDELLERGRKLLTEHPRTRAELAKLLHARWPEADPTALAYGLSYLEPLIQVPPRGLWRQSGQARWTTAQAWLGYHPNPASIDDLIARYLAAFGPATVADVQAWSGLTRLGSQLDRERLRIYADHEGRELLDVPGAPLPPLDTPAPSRFLAPFDNAILAHADRGRIVDPGHRRLINRDRLMRTFLLDGFVAGAWRLEGASLVITPFRPLGRIERDAVVDEGRRLLDFLAEGASDREVRVQRPYVA